MLDKAVAAANAAPPAVDRAALGSLGLTAVLTIAIALGIRPGGSLPRTQVGLLTGAFAALVVVAAAALVRQLRPRPTGGVESSHDHETRRAVCAALAVWFPLLLVPIYLSARSTQAPSEEWLGFGFMDKRWETATYFLGALAPMFLVVVSARLLETARERPTTWRAWIADAFGGAPPRAVPRPNASVRALAPRALGVACAVALAWYFYGPPWFLDRYDGPVDYHEAVHFGGLQAIASGKPPYVGPGAVQYGPGTQFAMYLYMRHVGTFSIVGTREAWALLHWVGVTIFFVALVLAFGFARGIIAATVAIFVYPTLQLFHFVPLGTYAGFFGWGNLLRYVGAFTLVVALPPVIRRCPSRGGAAAGIALGVLFAFSTYMGQENLPAGVLGCAVLVVLLLATRSASGRAVAHGVVGVVVGFFAVWLPILVYYLVHSELRRFLQLYFFVPRAVANGYSNIPFLEGWHSAWGRFYYLFPFVLALLALASVVSLRPIGIASGEWSRERVTLVALTVSTVVLYAGALLRSDATHLSGVMLPVPALAVVATLSLPRTLGAPRTAIALLAGAAIAAAFVVLVPRSAIADVAARAKAPYADRARLAADEPPPAPPTPAGRRVGRGLAAAPVCCTASTWSMPQFIRLMDRIHRIVGGRRTYVDSFPDSYPGLVYFAAALDPAPISLEPYTMVLTRRQLLAYLDDFRARVVPQTAALLTQDLGAAAPEQFRAAYPNVRKVILRYRGKPYYVLLR